MLFNFVRPCKAILLFLSVGYCIFCHLLTFSSYIRPHSFNFVFFFCLYHYLSLILVSFFLFDSPFSIRLILLLLSILNFVSPFSSACLIRQCPYTIPTNNTDNRQHSPPPLHLYCSCVLIICRSLIPSIVFLFLCADIWLLSSTRLS